ncbi:hypothetical protein B0H11DRAFT_1932736 [Mycena galericulata]|nr:hypothetical protein B0H11DRAFT_1932736 [Mycena galericulata]
MPSKKRAAPAEPLMHGIYCYRYFTKNREELNKKTRERMRWLRASDVTVPPEVLAARLEARQAAARKYRERNQSKLKMKARESRAAAAEERRQVKEHQERKAKRAATRREATSMNDPAGLPIIAVDSSFRLQRITAADTPAQIPEASSEDEHRRICALLEDLTLRHEAKICVRCELHRYNSLGAAWERYHVWLFFGALQLAMTLQSARDAGIDLARVAVDTP